jgi:hypothetical protein
MVLPFASLTILDGGLGVSTGSASGVAVIGTSTSGTADTPLTSSDPTLIKTTFGGGQLVDAACLLIQHGVTPTLVKAATSSPGTAGAVATSRVGSSTMTMTVAGAATDAFEVIVKCTKAATSLAAGDGTFSYSLDNGDSYSSDIAIPTAGTYLIPDSGLTLTFVTGTLDVGDKFTFVCTAPAYSTTNLGAAYDALALDPARWRFVWFLGEASDATGAATMAATIKGKIEASETAKRYARAIMGCPDVSDGYLSTAFASFVSKRVAVAAGFANHESGLKSGRFLKRCASWTAAIKAAIAYASEDLGRVKSGPVSHLAIRPDGSSALYRDENLSPGLTAQRFTTLRSIPGVKGYFVTEGRLMADAGSDFDLWQNGVVMDLACETLYPALAYYINDDLRTNADGSLYAADANAIDEDLTQKLKDVLLNTTPQHISGLFVQTRRDTNILSTRTLSVRFRIQPKGYAKYIEGEIAYTGKLPE